MKTISSTVNMTDIEMDWLEARAQDRCDQKSLADTWGPGEIPRVRNFESHLLGIMGEYAVVKHLGGSMDWMGYGKLGDKNTPDVVIDDRSYAVKTTRYYPPILKIASAEEIEKADEIVLCRVDMGANSVDIVGTIEPEEFWAHCYTDDFGYGKRFCYQFGEQRNDQKNPAPKRS